MNSEKVILTYLRELHKYDTTAYLSYSTLSRNISDEKIIGILTEIAADEKKHIGILENLIQKTESRLNKK